MKILVTGGAGYIGSVTAAVLVDQGHEVVVLDDLSTGHRAAVPAAAQFVEGRVQDAPSLAAALEGAEAVIHFASLSLVGESIDQPRRYFRENLGAAVALLDGMAQVGVSRLVFSSSAAVYGAPDAEVITEDVPPAPVNPYGHTKVMIERMLAESARAEGLAALSLRYFNACGAHEGRGEDHDPETHLIPRLCARLLGRLDEFAIHGRDHPTPDGTPVRDYVHVLDLANAHAAAVTRLDDAGFEAVNLGTGRGASVQEVVAVAEQVAGERVVARVGPRREGDPPRLVASRDRAARRLGWTPRASELTRILEDALRWHRDHPTGYAQS